MNIVKGKLTRPQRIVIYGQSGVGKTTMGAQFPDPIFFDLEDGSGHIDVPRVMASEFKGVGDIVRHCDDLAQSHEYKTLVVDSLSALERVIIEEICRNAKNGAGVATIEEVDGFGKAWAIVSNAVQVALSAFNRVLESGKHVVILAHQSVVRFDPPDGATPYDRYELQCAKDRKGGKGTASIVKEWCDALIFATYKTIVVEADSKKGKTTQAVGGREHICYATHSAAWDAKNRHGLPDKAMPFAWETIARLIAPVAHSVPNIVPEKQPEPEPELHAPPPKPPTIPARTHAEIPLAARLAIEPRAEEVNEFLKETNRIGELETWEDAPRDWLHRVARDPGAFIEFLKHRKK